jgi:hypothetical protein
MRIALLNGLLAAIFTIPILIPSLCIATPPGTFGCLASMETTWPGTWLLVAFFVFTIVGVLGAFGWSLAYWYQDAMSGKSTSSKGLVWLQIILFEVGVLVATGMMAAIGYVGGNFIAHGGGVAVSSEVIRTQIIPPLSNDPNNPLFDIPPIVVALGIGLGVLAQFVGLLNIFRLKKKA